MPDRARTIVLVALAALLALAGNGAADEVAEVEPNDNASQASAQTIFTRDTLIAGAILTAADVDWYRLDLSADRTVRFESFDRSGVDCGGISTALTVFDATPAQINADGASGIGNCSALVMNLAAGTYYVRISSGNAATIPAYKLEIRLLPDQGSEAEPNDSVTSANALPGPEAVVLGDHSLNPDQDWYAITIGPHGGSVRAEIVEGGGETCEALGIDSRLTLYDANGVALVDDDDTGRGYCSLIDGTGTTPAKPAAHNLAPGTYYLQVRASSFAIGNSAGQFAYRLAVNVVPIDSIFTDGFESGNFGAWSAASVGGGDLSIHCAGAIAGTCDLQGVVNDTTSLYVEDDTPADEDRYRVRFRFDTNGFDPGAAQGHFRTRIFLGLEETPTRRLMAVVLKFQNGTYSLEGRARLDSGAQADTGFFPIANGVHAVELDWVRATGSASADGSFRLWIDGTLMSTLRGLQNNVSSVDFARMGVLSLKTGASGTMYWDDLDSRRRGYVGP